MNNECSMRPVTQFDAEQVAAHGLADETFRSERRIAYATWVRGCIDSGRYVGWFALDGERVIAGAGAILLDWGPTRSNPFGTMGRINNVFTEPAWRRRGLARALLVAVLDQCEGLGVREFNLAATETARSLYSSLGFEPYPFEMRRRIQTGSIPRSS